MCLVGERPDDQLARELDLLARHQPDELRRHPAAVEPLEGAEEHLDLLDRLGRQVDRRRLHLHHPPPGDVDRQRGDVVEVGVRDEPGRRRHEGPGLAAQVEAQLQLGHPPVGLDGRPRIPLDRQALVDERPHRGVVDRVVERFHRRREIRRQRTAPPGRDVRTRSRGQSSRISSPSATTGRGKLQYTQRPRAGDTAAGAPTRTGRRIMPRRTQVFGPAYLDRVLRVDRPLLERRDGPPIDQSVDGRLEFGPGLTLIDPGGATIEVVLPGDWPGPTGRSLPLATALRRRRGMASHRDRRGVAGRPRGDGSGLRGGARGRARRRTRPGRRPDEPRRGRSPGAPEEWRIVRSGWPTARPIGPCS